MKYRPEIDGLRSFAVIPVILFHAGFSLFGGGYVGVDVFFVISGYLITTIIIGDHEGKGFSIIEFYERRARRILPALMFVILCTIPVAWLLYQPFDMEDYGTSLVAVSAFSSNILFWLESGYFDTAAELKPMLHTWSLAVEEQFYVIFPLLLIAIWRLPRAVVLGILVGLTIASLLVAQWGVRAMPIAAFYLLPARGWELLIGALVAFYLKDRSEPPFTQTIREGLGILGLIALGYSIVAFDHSTPWPSFYALAPVLGTAALILAAQPGTIANRVLSFRWFVSIGLISYSAYLIHYPLFAFVRYASIDTPPVWLMSAMAILSLPLAWVSWKFIEAPFRDRRKMGRSTIFILALVASAAVAAFGLTARLSLGFPDRAVVTNAKILDYTPDNKQLKFESWRYMYKTMGASSFELTDNPRERDLIFSDTDPRVKLLIVGNSHAKDMFNMANRSDVIGSTFQIARFGTQIADILTDQTGLLTTPNYQAADIIVITSYYSPMDIKAMDSVVERFKQDGKKVVIAKPIFGFHDSGHRNQTDMLFEKLRHTETLPEKAKAVAATINHDHFQMFATLDGRAREYVKPGEAITATGIAQGVPVLDRMAPICDAEARTCYMISDTLEKHFFDYGHFTLAGAAFFAARADAIGWWAPLIKLATAIQK